MLTVTAYGIVLLIANAAYIALFIYTYSKKNKRRYEEAGNIPFDDEERV